MCSAFRFHWIPEAFDILSKAFEAEIDVGRHPSRPSRRRHQVNGITIRCERSFNDHVSGQASSRRRTLQDDSSQKYVDSTAFLANALPNCQLKS